VLPSCATQSSCSRLKSTPKRLAETERELDGCQSCPALRSKDVFAIIGPEPDRLYL
jgi:hypothetical protein